MTKLRTVVEEVSTYLVDQEECFEFTHWSEDEVLTYLQDAVRIVALNLKHLFTVDKVVELRPGSYQKLGAGCSELRGVTGSVDRHGQLTSSAHRTSLRASQTINRPVCQPSTGYKVASYQLDSGNLQGFYVEPPVPATGTYRVMVSCYHVPTFVSLDEELPIPDAGIPVLKEFMLYYAWGRDTESVAAREHRDKHWANGVMLIGTYKTNPTMVPTVAQQPAEVPV